MGKAPSLLHVVHGILFDSSVRGLLLEDVDELPVLWIRADAVDDGEGEFAFCEVLAEAFVLGVDAAPKVQVVVADLEDDAHDVDEGDEIPAIL